MTDQLQLREACSSSLTLQIEIGASQKNETELGPPESELRGHYNPHCSQLFTPRE